MTVGDVVDVSGRAMLVVAAQAALLVFLQHPHSKSSAQAALGMLSRGMGRPLSHPSLHKSFESISVSSCRFLLFSRILHDSALSRSLKGNCP